MSTRLRVLAAALVCAWTLALPAGGAAAAPALTLPAPTGPLPVGVRSQFVVDPARLDATTGRPRALPVRLWYPARRTTGGAPARYLPATLQPLAERTLGAPAGTFDVDTHAVDGAAPRRHIRGVILVSPGFHGLVAFSTGQIVELASHGWALVAIDHPHDTYVVEQPDGTLIYGDPGTELADIEAAFAQRVLDVGVVLRALPALLGRSPRGLPVAMFGHSLGGATAAEAMLEYRRLDAGIDIDGTPFGRVVQEGLDEPFGVMLSDPAGQPRQPEPRSELLLSNLRGPHPVARFPVAHNGFTDFVVFNPQATAADAALGARFDAFFHTGVDTEAAAGAALAAQRRFLVSFIGRHLRGHRHERHRARGGFPLAGVRR